MNAIQALSQLSYTPKFSCAVRQLLYYSTIYENVKRFFCIFEIIFSFMQLRYVDEGKGGIGYGLQRCIVLCLFLFL